MSWQWIHDLIATTTTNIANIVGVSTTVSGGVIVNHNILTKKLEIELDPERDRNIYHDIVDTSTTPHSTIKNNMLMVQYATDSYPYIRIWGENAQHKQMDHDIHGQKIEYFTFGDNVLSPIFEINLHPIYNYNHVLQSHGIVRLVGKNANYQEYDVLKWHNTVSDPTLTINSQSNTPALTYHPTTNIFDLAADIIPTTHNQQLLGNGDFKFAEMHSSVATLDSITDLQLFTNKIFGELPCVFI